MKKIHCFPVFQIPRSGTEHAPAGKIPAIRKIAALFGLDRINQTTFPAVIIIKTGTVLLLKQRQGTAVRSQISIVTDKTLKFNSQIVRNRINLLFRDADRSLPFAACTASSALKG